MNRPSKFQVEPKDLRWRCDPDRLGFETTDDIPCCHDIIGQGRALDAIRLGLEIESPGYNIYVSGLTGTGKSTTIKRLLQSIQHDHKSLSDICYVYNFRAAELPRCLVLPAGKGSALKRRMADVLKMLRDYIPNALESDAFSERRKETVEAIAQKRAKLATELEEAIEKKGFKLLEVQYGPFTRPVIAPVIEEKPVDMVQLATMVDQGKLPQADFDKIKADHDALTQQMEGFLKLTREMDRELRSALSNLETDIVSPIVDVCVKEIGDDFPYDGIEAYLNELRRFAIENVDRFGDDGGDSKRRERPSRDDRMVEFDVNVVVDNALSTDIPVIIETSPNFNNLFGAVERVPDGHGDFRTDFTMIRAGSLLRANGGFLVLSLTDVIVEPAVWPALKRALKNQKITIQGLDSLLFPITSLKPEPIKIDVKVVLIGDAESYQILYHYDEDFRKIFKVKAEFDSQMPNTEDNLGKYGQFIRSLLDKEGLRTFHKTAVAAVLEEGARMAGRQDKFTAKFSDIADVIREASYWANKIGSERVEAAHVAKAVEERVNRVNLIEEKINEMLTDGTILIDIDGSKVGQVNALAVYDLGDHSFGKPVRITVETSMGRTGIIDIERESEMSGRTYNKAALILEGFLRRTFAQEKPLTMSATVVFEQSYSDVDGDSASSTELYALLSSLAEVPIRQDIAVTGSVNQKGEVQPIGGVNEKIQGFYDVCRLKGLSGTQGVMIPKRNVVDLMLRLDVVKSIEDGKFHVYAVDTIAEGIELLTGTRAGERRSGGAFEKDTVLDLADRKLSRFAETMKEFSDGDEE